MSSLVPDAHHSLGITMRKIQVRYIVVSSRISYSTKPFADLLVSVNFISSTSVWGSLHFVDTHTGGYIIGNLCLLYVHRFHPLFCTFNSRSHWALIHHCGVRHRA
jgi:hypothetical protein